MARSFHSVRKQLNVQYGHTDADRYVSKYFGLQHKVSEIEFLLKVGGVNRTRCALPGGPRHKQCRSSSYEVFDHCPAPGAPPSKCVARSRVGFAHWIPIASCTSNLMGCLLRGGLSNPHKNLLRKITLQVPPCPANEAQPQSDSQACSRPRSCRTQPCFEYLASVPPKPTQPKPTWISRWILGRIMNYPR